MLHSSSSRLLSATRHCMSGDRRTAQGTGMLCTDGIPSVSAGVSLPQHTETLGPSLRNSSALIRWSDHVLDEYGDHHLVAD